ncbi:MAG: type II secretion system F family protein [Alphaproteobacteria bacterium]|nr:type II secretion system F family protein [Alphaproteobacteria bacterium]
MAASAPSLFGLPIEYVIYGAIALCLMVAAPIIINLFSPEQKLRNRAAKLKQRVKNKTTYESKIKEEKTKTLRREEGDKSLPLMSRFLGQRAIANRLRDRMARSAFNITAERYVLYNSMAFAITSLLLISVAGFKPILALLLAFVIGFGVPHYVTNMSINRRAKKFLKLFPDAIDLIVRGLRAGLPVTESIKMVAKEIDAPVNHVFQTMTEKMALGVPLEKTLYETASKYRITEFDFFVTSIVLQRETGGNLSEILNNLSEALRQRLMMRMKIKAMSSEARASMYIIAALPFVVAGGLSVTTPEYLIPLIEDYRGNISLAVAGGMMFMGVFIMTRMTKFEI